MERKIAVAAMALAALLFCANAFCQPAGMPEAPAMDDTQVHVISVATEAVREAGLSVEDVNIIYDQGGQLWSERIGRIEMEQGPNKGILERGNTNTDHVVYFDYKEPLSDVWIFINKDTGEVVEIYREE